MVQYVLSNKGTFAITDELVLNTNSSIIANIPLVDNATKSNKYY